MKENSINKGEREAIEMFEFCSRYNCVLDEKRTEIISNLIKQLQKENEELKRLMAHKNGYTKLLEEDLFENCENFVISKDKIKEQIKRYAKLSDDCYSEWKKLSPFDEDYKNIRDEGMCCDAIVNVLQELLEGRK